MKKNKYRQQIKQLNAARQQYNPLRGISIQKVVNVLEAGERGDYHELQWLYRMIEKRDAVVRALVRRRSSALQKLEWQIKTVPADQLPDGHTEEQAAEQAKALRGLYEQIENVYAAIKALALAEFRGFTHLEKVYQGNRPAPDAVKRLEFVEQWYWTRDGLLGDWLFDPNMRGSYVSGEEVDPAHLIIREVDDPINEIALIAFLRKSMSQKDWDSFVEVFGIPDLFFEMPAGLSAEDMKKWLAEAERMAGDGTGAIPNGGKVQAVGGDVRGTNPFESHIKYQDSCVVLAGTGGKLSMLTDPTGLGSGASDAHEDAFDDIAAEEARTISELFQRSLDLPLLKLKFPDQPVMAYFDLSAVDSEDTTALCNQVKTLSDSGYQVDPAELQERTGITLAVKEVGSDIDNVPLAAQQLALARERAANAGDSALAESLGIKIEQMLGLKTKNRFGWKLFNRKAKPTAPTDQLLKTSRKLIAEAMQQDRMPIAERLAEIIDETPDADLFEAIERFRSEELPALAEVLLSDPSAAQAFEDSMSAALLSGLAGEES
jgi:phage gp29-like protein